MNFPKLKSDAILAPMAGVTDVAFRLLCKQYGAGLTSTEMISANALVRENKATLRMIDVVKEEKPRVIQLFGQKVEYLVKAAKFVSDKCEIIDLNFGCPASKIIQQGSGSALLERPAKIKEIVQAVNSAVDNPISCKLRIGINKRKINIVKVAQICEQAGAKMISIHARTQKQGYTGTADWKWIKRVKEKVSILVAGNGDVRTVEDYLRMKKETNCNLVMIGRGAIGNPYLFQQIKEYNTKGKYSEETGVDEQVQDFFKYLKFAKKHNVPFNNIKFHAQAFTKGFPGAGKIRLELSRAQQVKDIQKIYDKIS
tara:strand:+ start:568 stop:1503 length:936 start_codon:yes stop_codon:yes gene_type:complete